MLHQNQHLSKDLLAPMILGKIISIDDWVPERPPKPKGGDPTYNHMRIPSPELPPPPPVESLNLINPDDLPLPPPELLKQDTDMKALQTPSRRNSFAGQSNYHQTKVKTNNIPISPPAIPMRPKIIPTPIMTINSVHHPQDHTHHAQRVILQKQISESHATNAQQLSPRLIQGRVSDSRLSVRKRAHNSSATYASVQQQQTPPPLKPRMRNQIESNVQQNTFTQIASSNKVR
jgi:protein Shroom